MLNSCLVTQAGVPSVPCAFSCVTGFSLSVGQTIAFCGLPRLRSSRSRRIRERRGHDAIAAFLPHRKRGYRRMSPAPKGSA
jgi:uncharacterized iron-regulated membrane protein